LGGCKSLHTLFTYRGDHIFCCSHTCPCRIWRRKRRERIARYSRIEPVIEVEGPWVKTKVFDPYAESDFRTPTNQMEFSTSPGYRYSYTPTVGDAPTTSEQDRRRLLGPSRASEISTVSGYSDATAVGEEETKKIEKLE
jgi:hypothetical protein